MIELIKFLKQYTPKKVFDKFVKLVFIFIGVSIALMFAYLIISGSSKWSGRSLTLLDPTYAKK